MKIKHTLMRVLIASVLGSVTMSSAFADDTCIDDFDAYSESHDAQQDNSNWMASITNGARLSDLSIPGTHDTTTYTQRGTFWPYTFNGVITQTMSFAEQFKAGIRFIDIRVAYSGTAHGTADHDGTTGAALSIFHGAYYLDKNFYDVLQEVNAFLDNHPQEVILMRVKVEHGGNGLGENLIRDAVNVYMTTGTNARHVWTGKSQNPTLGQMRGKLIVLNDLVDPDAASLPYMPMTYREGKFSIQDEFEELTLAAKWTDIKNKINEINDSRVVPRGVVTKYINYLSASSGLSPSSFAASENPWTYEYIDCPIARRSMRLGIMVMDFPGPDLIKRIIDNNNGYLSSFYTGAPTLGRIQNVWKTNQYLNIESDEVQSSLIDEGWISARWNIVNDAQGWVRIQNQWKPGQYLHIEYGTVESSTIDMGWVSAKWRLIAVGNDQYRIQNVWKPDQYLHIENGYLQSSPIWESALSARWNIY